MLKREKRISSLSALLVVTGLFATGSDLWAGVTKAVYAPPIVWGEWTTIVSVAGGSQNWTVTVAHDGDTTVFAEVQYYDTENKRRRERFLKSVRIRTGNNISNIKVRLKGVPFGTACRVTAE